jgi:hypothetical protein
MEFFSLAPDPEWDTPFHHVHDLFKYVARVPLFSVGDSSSADEHYDMSRRYSRDFHGDTAKERDLIEARPNYAEWVKEFRPRCRESGHFPTERAFPEIMRLAALAHFDCINEHDNYQQDVLGVAKKTSIWTKTIERCFPHKPKIDEQELLQRKIVIKALKKIILENDRSFSVVFPVNKEDSRVPVDNRVVVDFIRANIHRIANAALARELQDEKSKLSISVWGVDPDHPYHV